MPSFLIQEILIIASERSFLFQFLYFSFHSNLNTDGSVTLFRCELPNNLSTGGSVTDVNNRYYDETELQQDHHFRSYHT